MADNFDPSKNDIDKSSQGSQPQKELHRSNSNSQRNRPSYRTLWKRMTSINSGEQSSLSDSPPSYAEHSRNSSNQNAPKYPPQSFSFVDQVPKGSASEAIQPQVHIIEQRPRPYWESGENSFEDWNQEQREGVAYTTEQADAYAQDQYYANESQYKQKGLSKKIDRFVQRIPALGVFYKQPLSPSSEEDIYQQFKYEQTASLTEGGHQSAQDISPDDSSLNKRYSDVTRLDSINLQLKDETQPVDVSVHHGTNQIYLCDVGRSVVEIYNMNKTFQRAMNNATMIKFRPTAITVTADGTIIVASHFSHCLHMYSPNGSPTDSNPQSYKQFKLGVEGTQAHQFYQPAGIAIDRNDGYLYVCDRGNRRIQVFTPDGICERIIELYLNTKKKCPLDPIRIATQNQSDQLVCIVGSGDAVCFIPKHSNGRIYVDPYFILDRNGLGLDNAAGLAVDGQDRIFISDTNHHRIVICTSDGHFITSVGTEGSELGRLKRPCGLDVTDDGTIIVTDAGNKRLQLFGLVHAESSNEKAHDSNSAVISANDFPIVSL
ncbi:unnamed protein product [Adineta ricciae]|uniref:Uncharacterized protein n=1 Tax=Adineta ricciae TaxID=249248 RepID=A0A815L9Z6_ADIRI|nr:unnamed protein product [Adineta ricciae]